MCYLSLTLEFLYLLKKQLNFKLFIIAKVTTQPLKGAREGRYKITINTSNRALDNSDTYFYWGNTA